METVLLAGHPQGCTLRFLEPGLGDTVESWPLFPGRTEAAFRKQAGLEAQQPGPSRTLTLCVTQAGPSASLSSCPFIREKGRNNPTSRNQTGAAWEGICALPRKGGPPSLVSCWTLSPEGGLGAIPAPHHPPWTSAGSLPVSLP